MIIAELVAFLQTMPQDREVLAMRATVADGESSWDYDIQLLPSRLNLKAAVRLTKGVLDIRITYGDKK